MRSGGIRFGVVGLVVIALAAYVASVTLYAQGDAVRRLEDITPAASGDEPSATINVEELQSNNSALAINLAFNPGSALLDPKPTTSRRISAFASDPRRCRPGTPGPRACSPA